MSCFGIAREDNLHFCWIVSPRGKSEQERRLLTSKLEALAVRSISPACGGQVMAYICQHRDTYTTVRNIGYVKRTLRILISFEAGSSILRIWMFI